PRQIPNQNVSITRERIIDGGSGEASFLQWRGNGNGVAGIQRRCSSGKEKPGIGASITD
ncbi:unnamed protein product, partial [Linum tenue]